MTAPPRKLPVLRARLRRAQFIVGLGFFSFFLGALVSSSLAIQLPSVHDAERPVAIALFGVALSRLWVVAVLPLLAYGAARILDLRPLSTALGAALCGETFQVAILAVSLGWQGVYRGFAEATFRLLTLAGGVWLTRWAVQRGRSAARRVETRAKEKAAARQDEYAEFLATAERIANAREPSSPADASPPKEGGEG